MIKRPECNCQPALFGKPCKPVLRRKWHHIGWWCPKSKSWLKPEGRLWLPHIEVTEYLKKWNAKISDIPEVG